MVHPIRFERTTFGSASQRSIQLSYGCSSESTVILHKMHKCILYRTLVASSCTPKRILSFWGPHLFARTGACAFFAKSLQLTKYITFTEVLPVLGGNNLRTYINCAYVFTLYTLKRNGGKFCLTLKPTGHVKNVAFMACDSTKQVMKRFALAKYSQGIRLLKIQTLLRQCFDLHE